MYSAIVFTDGGLVLWTSESTMGSQSPTKVLNDYIANELIGAVSGPPSSKAGWSTGGFAVRCSRAPECKAACAVVYSELAPVKGAGDAAQDICKIFSSLHRAEFQGADDQVELVQELDLSRFGELASLRLSELERDNVSAPAGEITSQTAPAPAPENSRENGSVHNTAAAVKARPVEAQKRKTAKKSKKAMRKWDGSEGVDGTDLDYSEQNTESDVTTGKLEDADLDAYGHRAKDGFMVNSLGDELRSILAEPSTEQTQSFGFLKGLMGGKTLDDKALAKALDKIEDQLVEKNVAKEVATELTAKVRQDLKGSTTKNWTSVSTTVKQSMERALSSILTPNTSVDILLDIKQRKRKGGRPYVLSVVGVNGVGKSTNLGKIAFWLLQNDLRVLVAACDTFRSGAVEQLKVHVERLKHLTERQGSGVIELYAQGYGKDAAVIAQKAVEYAERHRFDVVLIDTAGRRHNDERLMSSLEKFGKLAQPDKVIMVGEALVGTDSVQQARNFDNAFGHQRGLDFFLVSKVDTVGDMVGTLVNMTHSTGVPILFVGVGQNYTDLRTLSVDWAVNQLLS